MNEERDRTGIEEDPFRGIRFTWLMAVQTWVEDRIRLLEDGVGGIIVGSWETALGRSLNPGEIDGMAKEATRAFWMGRGNLGY